MSYIRRLFQSHRARVTMALIVIGLAVVLAFFAPKETDPNIGLVNDPYTPTVGVTNPVGTLTINRSITYNNVQLTVTQVQEAKAFSDDEKRAGVYTVRVNVHIVPGKQVQTAMNLDFSSLARLVLNNGQVIAPKLINASPIIFPQQPADGYFDFPVSTQVPLSSLTLRMGNTSTVAFTG